VAAELPLRIGTYFFSEPGSDRIRVVVGAETDPSSDPGLDVMFGYVLLDPQGVIAASAVLEAADRRFSSSAVVAPGAYTLKVAALDRLGQSGSVARAFRAELATGAGLRASDLLVARVPPRADAPLDPIIGGTTEDRVLAYLELYAGDGQSLRDVDVRVHIVPADASTPVRTAPATVSSRDARLAIARVVLPIQDLPDGRYLMRAEVADGDRVVGRVERSFGIARATSR